jgi:polar amino acid transport system substrate-binding protein
MLRKTLTLLALAALMSSCVPAKPTNDPKTAFNPETIMGEIQSAGKLVVAVPSDRGPFGEPAGDVNIGFNVTIAQEVADSLQVELEVRHAPNATLLGLVRDPVDPKLDEEPPRDPAKADIVIPLLPITEELVGQRTVALTDPYFVGHQRLLVPDGSTIDSVDDLSGKTVCQVVAQHVDVRLSQIEEGVKTISPISSDCVSLLRKGEADAATASDALLAVWNSELGGSYEVVGDELSTFGYGMAVQSGASSWRDYVNAQFQEFKFEGGWLASYDKILEPWLGPTPLEPPHMTVEEAAALQPRAEEDPASP